MMCGVSGAEGVFVTVVPMQLLCRHYIMSGKEALKDVVASVDGSGVGSGMAEKCGQIPSTNLEFMV